MSNFRHIRNCLTTKAATIYLNDMIMPWLSSPTTKTKKLLLLDIQGL